MIAGSIYIPLAGTRVEASFWIGCAFVPPCFAKLVEMANYVFLVRVWHRDKKPVHTYDCGFENDVDD